MIFSRFPTKRKAVINTKSDKSFVGIIWERRRDYLILKDAQMLRPREEAIQMDGEVLIFVQDVEFMQLV